MSTQQRQAIHSIHNKKFWTEFFYLYESLPALWDVNNPLYKNRQVKVDAYDIMVDKLREIEPTADREDVLRKINIFRTNYRRECSRITLSLQEGRQYKSTLWYFDMLNFLQTADTRRERKRKLLDDGIEKSIMRKRRNITTIPKSAEKFIVTNNNGELIEYQTHSAHTTDIDYENYEEQDFDYVVEDLSHSLVESKNDATEMHNALQIQNSRFDDIEEDDEENSQTEYEHEFRNFTLQRNEPTSSANSQSSKIELTVSDNMGLGTTIGSEVADDGSRLIIADGSIQQYAEYQHDNASGVDETAASQWCLKATHIPQNLTLDDSKNILQLSTGINLSTHDSAAASSQTKQPSEDCAMMTTKYVRDVKTMTSNKLTTYDQTGKLSESSEIIAKSWAIQYEELTQEQRMLARKAINDILFEGCMGHLVIGPSGRVTICNASNYKNLKSSKDSRQNEVESGDVYEQATMSSSSTSSSANAVGISKHPTADEWLKL